MKISICIVVLIISLYLLPALVSSRHLGRPRTHHGHHHSSSSSSSSSLHESRAREVVVAKPNNYYREKKATKRRGGDTVQIAGSSLPDCSHACGSCSPCRLVMVSFVCSSLEEAETCPMAYKCMCRNRSYPVP